MKKGWKIALGAVCAVLLLATLLRVKTVPLEDGGRAVVYVPLFDTGPGGSAETGT